MASFVGNIVKVFTLMVQLVVMASRWGNVWANVCAQHMLLFALFVFGTLGLLLNTVAFFVVDRESGSFVVVLLNYPGLLAFTAIGGGLLFWCYSQE